MKKLDHSDYKKWYNQLDEDTRLYFAGSLTCIGCKGKFEIGLYVYNGKCPNCDMKN